MYLTLLARLNRAYRHTALAMLWWSLVCVCP
jgi:hypothetical protein